MSKYIGYFIAAIFIIAIIIGFCNSGSKTLSIDDYARAQCKSINQGLKDPAHPLRKRVESAHGTVKCTSAEVIKYEVTTLDSSRNAGVKGENVSYFAVWIKTHWNGIFHKDGYTTIHAKFDIPNNKCVSCEIAETNAQINMEDPKFWWEVGTAIGLLLTL